MLWLGLEGRKKLNAQENRIAELEMESARLLRAGKSLELEFTDLLDKVNHALGRITKRRGMREQTERRELEYEMDPELAHLDPVSQEIVRSRRSTWPRNGG